MVKEVKVINQDLAVLEALKITHNEAGEVIIENFEVVRDTLDSRMSGQDKLIIGTDENSVKSGQDYSTLLNKGAEIIASVFEEEEQRLKTELAKLTEPKKELQACLGNVQESIKQQVMYAKEQWIQQAIEDEQRNSSIDLARDMFKLKVTMRTSKKKIQDDVMLRVQEIEKEFAEKERQADELAKFCELQDVSFEVWKLHLESKSSSEIMTMIAKQKQEQAKREEEFQKLQQARAEAEKAEQAIPTLKEVTSIPTVLEPDVSAFLIEDTAEPLKKWIIEITTTPSKQKLLKQFCVEHGIEVRVANGLSHNR